MKILYTLFFVLVSSLSFAQKQTNYTVAVNENITTTLIFNDPIKSGVVGNSSYAFSFDRKNASPVGLLQGVKGPKSNLTVITENGNLYNITIVYDKNNTIASHFLKDSLAIGNINGSIINKEQIKREREQMLIEQREAIRKSEPLRLNDRSGQTTIVNDEVVKEIDSLYANDKTEYIRKFASNLVSKKDYFLRKYSSQNGMFFHLKDLQYNKNELYFAFKIDNTSGLDYDVREVEVSLESKDDKRSTSSQSLEIKPMMIYNQPSRVEGHKQKTFVYVFDKFSIGDKKSIICTLVEDKGERNIILALDEKTVNNPN